MQRALILTTTLLLIADAACVAADPPRHWQAGVAKVNITPREPLWMAGYAARNKPADGTLTELWAKSLVLDDGAGNRAVLLTLDLVGIDRELSQSVCRRLKAEYQLDRDQIALCVSHTHTGPVVGKNLRPMHRAILNRQQQAAIDKYASDLEAHIVAVVGKAMRRASPAQITWGNGRATFAVNRRNNPEARVPALRAEGKLTGPVDHDVPVLAVRDAQGKLQAVVFGYACHATVLSFYQWSGDYPGFAQQLLENELADCVAMFWAGCGADQNPLPRRTIELARGYGRQLADAVKRVIENGMQDIPAALKTTYREIDLRLDQLPTRKALEQDTQSSNIYVAARANGLLEQIDAGNALSPTYPYPIATWRLGDDIQWLFLGGEVVVDYAVRLKTELSGTRTWVAGYSNDVMAYIPSRRVWLEGGYEGAGAMVYYGLPTRWAPDVEEQLIRAICEGLAQQE